MSSSSPASPLSSCTTSALVLTATAAFFGLGIGFGRICFCSQSSRQPTCKKQRLCECGFDLTPCGPLQVSRHLQSALHKSNMYRTRGASLLLTAKINEYRNAITTHVVPEDIVLEVGCAEGLTTQRLAQRCKLAIGIDLYERLINLARKRVGQPPENASDKDTQDDTADINGISVKVNAPEGRGWSNLHFYTADALNKKAVLKAVNKALGIDSFEFEESKKEEKIRINKMIAEEIANSNMTMSSAENLSRKQRRVLRRIAVGKQEDGQQNETNGSGSTGRLHAGKVTKIWLDVSGSRETRTVVHLIEILDAMFRPELIVVKSDKLKNLSRRMYLPSSVIPGITHEPVNTPYIINKLAN